MGLKNYKPTSPARRGLILVDSRRCFVERLLRDEVGTDFGRMGRLHVFGRRIDLVFVQSDHHGHLAGVQFFADLLDLFFGQV